MKKKLLIKREKSYQLPVELSSIIWWSQMYLCLLYEILSDALSPPIFFNLCIWAWEFNEVLLNFAHEQSYNLGNLFVNLYWTSMSWILLSMYWSFCNWYFLAKRKKLGHKQNVNSLTWHTFWNPNWPLTYPN